MSNSADRAARDGVASICHLTSVHRVDDVRIFHKECETLVGAGFDVTLIGVAAAAAADHSAVKIRSLPQGGGRAARMILRARKAYRMALQTRADVYHFHDPELLPIGYMLKMRTGAKVIFDSHECFSEDILEKHWIPPLLRKPVGAAVSALEDAVAARIDLVVAATPHIGDYFRSRARRVVVVNNYPLPREFVPAGGGTGSRHGICYAGAMSPARGIIPFLDSLSFVPSSTPVHVAGIFASEAFERAVRAHPNWRRVTFHGQIGRSELAGIYATCLAGVVTFLPAPNHIHSQPNKLFEYMSAGLAVIGSNFPLWRSVIEDGGAGLCVDPSSPQQIAQAINQLIQKPQAAMELGGRGRELVKTTYNWDSEGRRLVASYHEILAN